ncbi:MAG: alpha/beta hydrolase [Anaerolineae bacterium]|nr:alpha/beta hydrolase [Anaerolineae bacterium]
MKHTIPYGNGQQLSYAEYGDSEGYPILIQHGLIASISDGELFSRLMESGKRLICIARPGYGDSSPYTMRSIGEWGEMVSLLADDLKLSQFDVLGMSSGAPYSYAISYALPHQVRQMFIFSGIPALYDDPILAHWPYPVNKHASLAELQQLAHDLFFANLSDEDMRRDEIRDSMMNNKFGVAQDFKLRCIDWGFRLSDVNVPVYMQHSRADSQVPFITAEMTAKLLPNCRLDIRDGEHFSMELLDDFFKIILADYF